MEKHFLSKYVQGDSEFRCEPWYNEHGDCIIYQTANEAVIRERIDELLTLYHSAIDNRLIGFQVKGVMAIIKTFGLEGLLIESQKSGDEIKSISLAALLMAAFSEGPKDMNRTKAYTRALIPTGPPCQIPAFS